MAAFMLATAAVGASGDSDAANPTDGTCGTNLKWTYIEEEDTNTLTIEFTGDPGDDGSMVNYHYPDNRPWAGFKKKIGTLIIGDGVTSIGRYAFYECENLTTVTFPDNDGLTTIGNAAFMFCLRLTSIDIPDTVTSIGGGAFAHCNGLTSVTFPENDGFTTIGEFAFQGGIKLTTVTIPKSVTTIDQYAFYGCGRLATLTFSEGSKLTTIGQRAFNDCMYLNCDLVIPNSVTTIGEKAFEGCWRLASITMPGTNYGEPVSSVFTASFYRDGKPPTETNPLSWSYLGTDKWYGDGDGKFYCGTLEVVFGTNGGPGNAPDSIEVEYGSKYPALPSDYPEDPNVSAYFTGWFAEKNEEWIQVTKDADVMLVRSPQTLLAHWDNYVKVTFDGNGNDGGSMDQQYIGASDADKCLKANGFEKEGFEFGGWYEAADSLEVYPDKKDVSEIMTINKPHMTLDLIAKWDPVYDVIDDVTGGKPDVSSAIHHRDLIIKIIPESGRSLPEYATVTMGTSPVSCSYSGGVITILSGIIEGDLTVTAICPPETYTVTGNITDGGIDATSATYHAALRITITADSNHTAPASKDDINMTMGGAAFLNFDYSGGTITINADVIEGPLVVTAACPLETYTVTVDTSDPGIASVEYMIGDGDFVTYTAPFKVVYGSKLTLRAVVADGYEFREWQPSGETGDVLNIGSVTADTELAPKTAKLLPEPPGPTPPGPEPEPKPKPKPQVITVTVTFESVGGGHTSEESVRVPLNSKVAVYGSTLVIGSGNATVKAIPDAGHVFSEWVMDEALFLGGGLVSDTVITASFGETVLVGMYIWKEPDKVDYSEGERFDPAGLVIALRYSDGSEVHVDYEGNESRFSFDPSLDTPLKPSDDRVTVKYGGMSAVQEITVSENGFPWWIVLIVAALALLILFIVLKRRKDDDEEESVG